MNTTTTNAPTIRTRSTHAYALVAVDRHRSIVEGGQIIPGRIICASIVGYAASDSAAVQRRADRMSRQDSTGSRIVHVRPIIDGAVAGAV